ncbi:hypothetical protein AGMMS49957_14580 [Synergistales bacterium]|nr:hypothetical protein AGMMS49957_14580 [Synergistales bacterium]
MDSSFLGCRLLKRDFLSAAIKIAVALAVAALSLSFRPDAALAGSPQEEAAKAAERAIIAAAELDLMYASKGILQESTKMALYEALLVVDDVLHNFLIDGTYKADHAEIKSEDKVFKEQSLATLYLALNPGYDVPGIGRELSFWGAVPLPPQRSDFDRQDPGYRKLLSGDVSSDNLNPNDIVVFSKEYKNRTEEFLDFAYTSLYANNSEAKGFLKNDDPLSTKMIVSLDIASDNAGNPLNALTGGNGGGHRQVMQAGNQIANFANQEISRLKVDINRLSEERARVARNERQEKIDVHAAFDQAVRIWKNTGSGSGY